MSAGGADGSCTLITSNGGTPGTETSGRSFAMGSRTTSDAMLPTLASVENMSNPTMSYSDSAGQHRKGETYAYDGRRALGSSANGKDTTNENRQVRLHAVVDVDRFVRPGRSVHHDKCNNPEPVNSVAITVATAVSQQSSPGGTFILSCMYPLPRTRNVESTPLLHE